MVTQEVQAAGSPETSHPNLKSSDLIGANVETCLDLAAVNQAVESPPSVYDLISQRVRHILMSLNTNNAIMVMHTFEHGCFVETCNHTMLLTYLNGPATRSNKHVIMGTDHRLIWPVWRVLISSATISFGWSCM